MGRIPVVWLGRGIGAGIIVVGTILVMWNAIDVDREYISNVDLFRFSLQQELNWLAFGSVVYLVAEILNQVVLRSVDDDPVEEPVEVS